MFIYFYSRILIKVKFADIIEFSKVYASENILEILYFFGISELKKVPIYLMLFILTLFISKRF